ncbi:MAG: ferritin family protein [Sulfurospirillum sp.]|nr:ferritin family protein [Sulfurospirillum sp.]
MNAYEYAMSIEKEGEAAYRRLADNATNEGLRKIFTMLADEEVKHLRVLEKMVHNTSDIDIPLMEVYADAKEIFADMKKMAVAYDIGDQQIDYYRRAMQSEDKSHEFYLQKAQEMHDPKHKEIFERIAAEELKHTELLKNILEYVEHPKEWIENAEFYKIGEAV